MMLTTQFKLSLARAASRGLIALRSLTGRGPVVRTRRDGIQWELDLREGIDLAIYLGSYQRLPARAVRALASRKAPTVLDIGSNIGAFTLPLARAVGPAGHVVAFEATDFAAAKLSTNLKLNPEIEPRVTLIQALLGSEVEGPKSDGIYSSWRVDRPGSSDDHPRHGGTPMSTAGAISTSVDALFEGEPRLASQVESLALIKLDVDGHELDILRGARRTIAAARPLLLIEIAPYVQDERAGGLDELLEELHRQGISLEDPDTGRAVGRSAAELRATIPNGAGADFIGTPT